MSEKYLRFQQLVLPETFERMISEELSIVSDKGMDFKLGVPDADGFIKVDLSDDLLSPFVNVGMIEVVPVESHETVQGSWNDVVGTYKLDENEDIEDVF